jgi:hypothetical protein
VEGLQAAELTHRDVQQALVGGRIEIGDVIGARNGEPAAVRAEINAETVSTDAGFLARFATHRVNHGDVLGTAVEGISQILFRPHTQARTIQPARNWHQTPADLPSGKNPLAGDASRFPM